MFKRDTREYLHMHAVAVSQPRQVKPVLPVPAASWQNVSASRQNASSNCSRRLVKCRRVEFVGTSQNRRRENAGLYMSTVQQPGGTVGMQEGHLRARTATRETHGGPGKICPSMAKNMFHSMLWRGSLFVRRSQCSRIYMTHPTTHVHPLSVQIAAFLRCVCSLRSVCFVKL